MYRLLEKIFTSDVAPRLAFKWWTLAYFMYDLDRFSTDIDIDVVTKEITDDIIETITSIGKELWSIKITYHNAISYRFVFSYSQVDHNIKIELNTRISPYNVYELINMRGLALMAQDKWTIFANKLVALSNRPDKVSRDLRDVHFFAVHNFPVNKDVVIERVKTSWKYPHIETFEQFIDMTIDFIKKNFSSRIIIDGNLGLVLSQEQKNRAKKNLIKKTIDYLELMK